MKVIISKHAGYCMGVKRAFAGAEEITEKFQKICAYGDMVHNRFALKYLEDKGVKIINDIKKIIKSGFNNVIIRAHGIPPYEEKILNDNKKTIFDFTCPKVKKVQLLAKDLSQNGRTIIIYGKKNHPEVIGIMGYCGKNIHIIKDLDEAKALDFKKIKNPSLISQTTMNSKIFDDICGFLKKKFTDIEIFNTLCRAPVKIQEAALVLAKNIDAMIVVGDKTSANTTTLFEKINKIIPAYFIETINDIDFKKLAKYKKLGITGGSSTPDWQMKEIKKFILQNHSL